MFQHFQATHQVEGARALGGKVLGADQAVVHLEVLVLGMLLRHLDRGGGEVYPQGFGAGLGQGLGQDAAAAAHIERGLALEATGGALDVAGAHRVDGVERTHLAARIPPVRGQPFEVGDFVVVDVGVHVLIEEYSRSICFYK